MGNYTSAYTGAQIDAAISKILSGTADLTFRKLTCTHIDCNTITTDGDINVRPATEDTATNGGQINFYGPSNTWVGFIDALQINTEWYLRVCKSGTAFVDINLNKGNIRLTNTNNNNAWIYCAQNAAIWSCKASTGGATGHLGMKTQNGRWALCTYNTNRLYFCYVTDANVNAGNNAATANIQFGDNGKIYGASFGDYAERRLCYEEVPGLCVSEVGDGSLKCTTERLQRGCHIISDTYGMIIGSEEENQVPIGVTGRILTHVYEGREEAAKHIGWPVCSGPNGTVSIMTEEEEQKYPSRIIGTISEIPTYEEWGKEEIIQVNGRIWIHLR